MMLAVECSGIADVFAVTVSSIGTPCFQQDLLPGTNKINVFALFAANLKWMVKAVY